MPSSGSRTDVSYTNPFMPLMPPYIMSTVIWPTTVLPCCCLKVLILACSLGIRSAKMSFKFVEEALACRAARTRQDAFLAPKSRAAAVSKAMAGEFGDLAGREGGKRNAAGTGAAAAAAVSAVWSSPARTMPAMPARGSGW